MHTRVCTPARGRMHRCIREHASMHRRVCTPARRRMHLYIEAYAHPLQGASTCTYTVLAHRPGGAPGGQPGLCGASGVLAWPHSTGFVRAVGGCSTPSSPSCSSTTPSTLAKRSAMCALGWKARRSILLTMLCDTPTLRANRTCDHPRCFRKYRTLLPSMINVMLVIPIQRTRPGRGRSLHYTSRRWGRATLISHGQGGTCQHSTVK